MCVYFGECSWYSFTKALYAKCAVTQFFWSTINLQQLNIYIKINVWQLSTQYKWSPKCMRNLKFCFKCFIITIPRYLLKCEGSGCACSNRYTRSVEISNLPYRLLVWYSSLKNVDQWILVYQYRVWANLYQEHLIG